MVSPTQTSNIGQKCMPHRIQWIFIAEREREKGGIFSRVLFNWPLLLDPMHTEWIVWWDSVSP